MPGIARKILIYAAIDGLIIQPTSTKGQRSCPPVKVKYEDSSISSLPRDQVPNPSVPESSFEAFGIIGLITVSRLSYLVTITRREQVAQIFGFPIYVVAGVAITPCSSKHEANESIRRTSKLLQENASPVLHDELESSDEDPEVSLAPLEEVEDVVAQGDVAPLGSPRSSVAEDVIRRRGSYGRFAKRWFSKSGWTVDQRRSLGLSISTAHSPAAPETEVVDLHATKLPLENEMRNQRRPTELLPKLLRTMQVFFGSSKSFYFSYDLDITRTTSQNAWIPDPDTPLHAHVDGQFFWNRHILEGFLSRGHDHLSLPLMQGFVGQQSFVVDSDPPQVVGVAPGSMELSAVSAPETLPASSLSGLREQKGPRPSEKRYLITLLSRRSIHRAGLRYLRRGVNEDGFTANMVETEQILSSATWDSASPVHSFVQIRGSIPLFFTQSAYSLKPVPVIQHDAESNYRACRRHFERLLSQYKSLQIINLIEKRGVEEPLGTQYEQSVRRFNEEVSEANRVAFEWFDFHHACRGMKFENVSQLLVKMKGRLEELGSTTQVGGEVIQRQSGVFRTNCMDCLDRTNVCQSSFAKHMLDLQLQEDGIDVSAQTDQETRWFNTLWADNGDAVSKQYASTAAMKGDYTRTRRRDYRGALNDLGLSLARFYNGMVNDYFSQASIDFLLGNVSEKVFDEFECDMMTKDPAVSIANMRQRAVELCQKRVVADAREEFHGGWALVSPSAPDLVKSWPMEEVILLLTDAALYLCRFNWDVDKVSSFERVHLANVTHIKFGTYITSTVSPAHTDEMRNVGFVISYLTGKSNVRRTNTRTLSTEGDIAPNTTSPSLSDDDKALLGFPSFFSSKAKSSTTRRLAFKAPYLDSSTAVAGTLGGQQTELQQVVAICADIERLALGARLGRDGDEEKRLMEKGDIISLQEAKKNTGFLEQLGHSIKKLVWA
ncbi:uncharacterized protein UV8b_04633 [Ustilaginoidea virens]|uniref:Uncharacterized protein n=1 Tax=Ustilaginoidea virens TaxID=1159556 RepID=A0A063C6J8_USTVR|nr:uncharacterized protein UV8b_04633 [Ustilaginoidea virens]QUC20392.1 hypothetical protein UV8b_04633 [Ustilaginoidea virens]GAO14682.1 hypothetical protein UVI_02029030 [Ustilaginoidea virens]